MLWKLVKFEQQCEGNVANITLVQVKAKVRSGSETQTQWMIDRATGAYPPFPSVCIDLCFHMFTKVNVFICFHTYVPVFICSKVNAPKMRFRKVEWTLFCQNSSQKIVVEETLFVYFFELTSKHFHFIYI